MSGFRTVEIVDFTFEAVPSGPALGVTCDWGYICRHAVAGKVFR